MSRAIGPFKVLHGLQVRKVTAPARAATQTAAVENPFASYEVARVFVDLPRSSMLIPLFTCKLRPEIFPGTMTDGFRRFVADKMAVSQEVIAARPRGTGTDDPPGPISQSRPEARGRPPTDV